MKVLLGWLQYLKVLVFPLVVYLIVGGMCYGLLKSNGVGYEPTHAEVSKDVDGDS